MQRKLSFILVLFLLIGLGIWAVDRWSVVPIFPLEPEDAVPAQSGLVIDLPRLDLMTGLLKREGFDPWQKVIIDLPGLQEEVESLNQLIDTLFSSRNAFDRTQAILSLNAINNEQLGGTWIVDLRSLGRLDPEAWLKAKNLDFQSSSFRGRTVWTVRLGNGRQVSMSKLRNLLVFAKLPYQVEAVLAVDPVASNWVKVLRPASNVSAICSIYLHPVYGEDIVNKLFTEAGRLIGENIKDWFQSARLDVFATEAGYRLEGVMQARESWMDTRLSPAAAPNDFWGMLPNNTAGIKAVNLSDYPAYFSRVSPQEGLDRFQRFFLPWINGLLFELTLRPFNAKLEDRQLYFLGCEDRTLAAAALDDWMMEVGVLQTLEYQGFTLTQVYEDESLFPWSGHSWNNPWWTLVGDYVVLAANRNTLENWIDQYVVGNVLPLTAVARQLTFSDSGPQFSFFMDWKQWRTGFKYIIADNDLAVSPADLGQLVLRFESNGTQGTINGLWNREPELQQAGDLSWRLTLSDEVAAGPWLLNGLEDPLIAVQDAAHQLYLTNNLGKIVWQHPLEERILSKVKTVELREQPALVFNTASVVHLMDLQGQHIAPFPIQLRNTTDTELTVVDFSADKNYSFFVVSTDGCVYGYDLQGSPIPAWNPKCQLGQTQGPLLHFQEDNKDYLALRNAEGTIRAFARDGSLRLLGDFPPSPNASLLQLQLTRGQKQIVSCSDSGLVEVLPLKGKPVQFRLPVGNNVGVKMIYEHFLGDDRKDYLLASGNTVALHAYRKQGLVKQFERRFLQPVKEVFTVLPPGNKNQQIGLLLGGSDQIYLLSEKGELYPSFPLAGSTPFFITDLFRTGEQHLVAGFQDEIMVYRLVDAFL